MAQVKLREGCLLALRMENAQDDGVFFVSPR